MGGCPMGGCPMGGGWHLQSVGGARRAGGPVARYQEQAEVYPGVRDRRCSESMSKRKAMSP